MGNLHESITDDIAAFVESQPMFFVATAPSSGGHVNVSPKGLDPVVVLGPHSVAYADRTGSGVETIAHLNDDGRITLMFCAFVGKPNIVRLAGSGRAVFAEDPDFGDLRDRFGDIDALRSIVVVDVDHIHDSCGYGVPLMELKGDRRTLPAWAADKSDDDLAAYWDLKNSQSVDGLPGISNRSKRANSE